MTDIKTILLQNFIRFIRSGTSGGDIRNVEDHIRSMGFTGDFAGLNDFMTIDELIETVTDNWHIGDEVHTTNTGVELPSVTVVDPDTKLDVEVAIFKHKHSGAMFGIDASYLSNTDGECFDPFDGRLLCGENFDPDWNIYHDIEE